MVGNLTKKTAPEVMAELGALANPDAVKVYRSHGIEGPCLGVRYAELYKLQKQLRGNHVLALELWGTNVHDARVLALLIADPKQMSEELVDEWLTAAENHIIAGEIARVAAAAPNALALALCWKDDPRPLHAQFSWSLLAWLGDSNQISDDLGRTLIRQIGAEVHDRPNRVRYSMGSTLIALGLRESLREEVFACSDAVGTIHVDHGKTGCKTPSVKETIIKTVAHRERKKK